MSDPDCVSFLQWALPRLRLRWSGFRKVRGQVCKRIRRRSRALGLPDLEAYRIYLEAHPEEWPMLDELCRVTISRFRRDRAVFAALEHEVLPVLARRAATDRRDLAVWSAGCASGEEPYTLALVWEFALARAHPRVGLHVLATDLDATMLERARAARYEAGSLRDLPDDWLRRGFAADDGRFRLRPELQRRVALLRHDVRNGAPDGPFDLVLCRNLAFTYFEPALQRQVAGTFADCVRPGGALVVGAHESLPEHVEGFVPWPGARCVYRKTAAARGVQCRGLSLEGDRANPHYGVPRP